jgi:hypothetical protein
MDTPTSTLPTDTSSTMSTLQSTAGYQQRPAYHNENGPSRCSAESDLLSRSKRWPGAAIGDFDNDGDSTLSYYYQLWAGSVSFDDGETGITGLRSQARGGRAIRFGIGARVKSKLAGGPRSRRYTVGHTYSRIGNLYFGLGREGRAPGRNSCPAEETDFEQCRTRTRR